MALHITLSGENTFRFHLPYKKNPLVPEKRMRCVEPCEMCLEEHEGNEPYRRFTEDLRLKLFKIFAIKILVHDWSTSLLVFSIASQSNPFHFISRGNTHSNINLLCVFLVSNTNGLITHADSTPILFDQSVALAASTSDMTRWT